MNENSPNQFDDGYSRGNKRRFEDWGFKIIKDNTEEPGSPDSMAGKVKGNYQGGNYRYRLRDDDYNIYYYILSDIHPSEGYEEEVIRPLDWAMYYAGCTMIEYKDPETGEYKYL